MGILSFISSKKRETASDAWGSASREALIQTPASPEAYDNYRNKPYPVYTERWDGERNYGELGYPINYLPDYRGLAVRSWQAYHESGVAQLLINNFLTWDIGRGLALNCEPVQKFIAKTFSDFNRDAFTDEVEDLWQLYATSRKASYSGMQTIHQIAIEARKNAIISGDCLVLLRYDGQYPSVQLIDGLSVVQPTNSAILKVAKDKGNTIKNGVEVSASGRHEAFYVLSGDNKIEKIGAYHSKTGRLMAWLMYGSKYRIGDTRGLPLYAVVLEQMSKLGRYSDATLASAEENAKVAFTIEHDKDASGENPFADAVKRAVSGGQPSVPESGYGDLDPLATKIAMTTNKQAFNMPAGATLKSHKVEGTVNFGDFFSVNFDVICATLGIAPEVALNKYNANYSASRAAIKMSEHKYKIDREEIANSFYRPIYTFWLDTRVLLGKLNAPGYLTAMVQKDEDMLQAFRACDFIGANMPHVDPVKEVKAERMKIGDDVTPLTTMEKATRNLGEGDWWQNIENAKQESERSSWARPSQNNAPTNGN